MLKLRRKRSHLPGMLQSSKVRAKPLIIVFAREILFRPPRHGVGLGRLRGLASHFYAAKLPPIAARRTRPTAVQRSGLTGRRGATLGGVSALWQFRGLCGLGGHKNLL